MYKMHISYALCWEKFFIAIRLTPFFFKCKIRRYFFILFIFDKLSKRSDLNAYLYKVAENEISNE